MLDYLRNKLRTVRLKAEYECHVQEQLLKLTETGGPSPVADDPGDWQLLGTGKNQLSAADRADLRTQARQLVSENPYAANALRLLEVYVVGPGLELTHRATDAQDPQQRSLAVEAHRLWDEFLTANHRHYSFVEHARRAWRDGECFVRKFETGRWPSDIRFIDPESIAATTTDPTSQGILTVANDVETPRAYLRVEPVTGVLLEQIDASEVRHTRIGADSNQKRGTSLFNPLLKSLNRYECWLETELAARKLQASIVLWRKVQGATAGKDDPLGSFRKDRFSPGSILTTSSDTELSFVTPNSNHRDGAPLGRMLLLGMAAGAGLPEFMLTSDASNANFASTMIAEGPAVKLFESEQQFFVREFTQLWRWVMQDAISLGRLPADLFDLVEPAWCLPQLVNRDRPQERFADVQLVKTGILSRAEIARRDGVEPDVMRMELAAEASVER